MPPFIPKQTVPFPAPTSPSSKSASAAAMAARTWEASTARSAVSLKTESLHSPTTGLTDNTRMPCALFSPAM